AAKCFACSKRGRSLGSSGRTCHSCCNSRREEPWTESCRGLRGWVTGGPTESSTPALSAFRNDVRGSSSWPRSTATQEEYCPPTTQESRHPPPGIRGPWHWASIGPRESAGSGPESTACRLSRVAPQSASHPLPPSSFLAVAW